MPTLPWWRKSAAASDRELRPELPFPPFEMRQLVGPTDESAFDNPTGGLVFGDLPPEQFRSILDFGCGCGRLARQFIQQTPRPDRYEGMDLHAGMIRWASENLAPKASGFNFTHHDVWYPAFNPGEDKPHFAAFPFADGEFSFVIAHSVFTHLTQDQTESYLAEMARVLEPDGVLQCTWFLFEKQDFPMMQEEQNTLFINEYDVRNAVIYDRDWVRAAARKVGLNLRDVRPPQIRGFQWELRFVPLASNAVEVEWPLDKAPVGRNAPPYMPPEAHQIGSK